MAKQISLFSFFGTPAKKHKSGAHDTEKTKKDLRRVELEVNFVVKKLIDNVIKAEKSI